MKHIFLPILFLAMVCTTAVYSQQKVDVWDFGAEQLDPNLYNNMLNTDVINGWYDAGITPGTSGNVLPAFQVGALSWTGGTNDRLRTTNTALTRYDENIANSTEFTGRLYVNSSGNANRFLTLNLSAGDEITLNVKTDSGGELNFQGPDSSMVQADVVSLTSDFAVVKFVASMDGSYKIYDSKGKPSYFRIQRSASSKVTVTGNIDKSAASGIPSPFYLQFTDQNGSIASTTVTGDTYSVDLPGDMDYGVSLKGADGFSVVSPQTISVSSTNNQFDIIISTRMDPKSKIDVWDFGAEQLDDNTYNNVLNETIINAWYDSTVVAGTKGVVLPSFVSAGILTWTGGTNDRLRTTNLNLSRYDENIANSTEFTGRIYVNSAANVTRFLTLSLNEDDELIMDVKTDSGGELNFQNAADPNVQSEALSLTSDFAQVKFVAKASGDYKIFDTKGKPSYFRIQRKMPEYLTITGAIDKTAANGLPSPFTLVFTNSNGKSWKTEVAGDNYSAYVPGGYDYDLSLEGANGYVISSSKTISVSEGNQVFDIAITRVELYTVSGNITGLGDKINRLTLVYTADPSANTIYAPAPAIDALTSTYSVELEPNITYTISALGVNDYFITNDSISISNANTNADVNFELKPTYAVTIDPQGLSDVQKSALKLTFNNLNEQGYTYTFTDINNIALREGVYSVRSFGLDSFPIQMKLTSNLNVGQAATSKTLVFEKVNFWSFGDKVIANGDPAYKGLLFSGNVSNEIAKSHLGAKPDATIQVPMSRGEKAVIYYYYSADFNIDGGTQITSSSSSTSIIESTSYDYTGDTDGYITINVGAGAATTYITDIYTYETIDFASTLRVGPTRDFHTVNEALDAVRRMTRENDERVTILIDPGNYEEMLDVDVPNITLKNDAAVPSISLANKGVDIDPNAVRITSYYGHGYNYFSMQNQRWSADVLAVNKENGYISYENKGAGTTNNSFWNTTVLIRAAGFEAEDIIFENSFNQYISKKESEDVVQQWASGGKGDRPTDIGNTSVQNRSFVERACAIALANNADKAILYKCRVVGRQDALYGGTNARFVMYKGSAMGAVDYIFGAMTSVFYKTDLAMNTSDVSSDQTYITAAQQTSGRGYLMYECNVTSAIPGTETASATRSKPGYYGRPWQPTTSEVVFYNTTIETSDFPGSEGKSLIVPLAWQNTLGGESRGMYEYGTTEVSGEDNLASRAPWSTLLTTSMLSDGTDITTFNFTKGTDGWDPIPLLIEKDQTSAVHPVVTSAVKVTSLGNQISISNVTGPTQIQLYDLSGLHYLTMTTHEDVTFKAPKSGIWVVAIAANDGKKAVKVFTY